jgi:hypothetical protein
VLIENEFGEISIDGGFLKDSGIQISEMSSGCICCSLVGDFGRALKDVQKQFSPDRILIEPSGVGKLSDVMVAVQNTIREDPELALNSFVTVADGSKVKLYMKNFGEFYNNQVESAGTIILSRTQKLTARKSWRPPWPCCGRRTPPPPSSPPRGTSWTARPSSPPSKRPPWLTSCWKRFTPSMKPTTTMTTMTAAATIMTIITTTSIDHDEHDHEHEDHDEHEHHHDHDE